MPLQNVIQMPAKIVDPGDIVGLSSANISELQRKFGKNVFRRESKPETLIIVWGIVREPMFILLIAACALYFILGQPDEGFMMLVAMALVGAISVYQEVKSSNAIKALKHLTNSNVSVLRDGITLLIAAEDLVPGDIMLLQEGMNIPADAIVLQQNDLTVNESIVTGESAPVEKNEKDGNNIIFQGTTINSGKCTARVTATANQTVLGQLGTSIDTFQSPKTLLQMQIGQFVRRMAFLGLMAFALIFAINFLHNGSVTSSLLFSLTLAMSVVPEEIPVAFSSFMALGAYKMSRLGIISRQPQVVENLGAVSVICLDKTGTITEDNMQVKSIYDFETDQLISVQDGFHAEAESVLGYAVLASEKDPFDSMEKAIVTCWNSNHPSGAVFPGIKMIFEYPLEGRPPMMTHVYEQGNTRIVAGKGATERIVSICKMSKEDAKKISRYNTSLASQGYRVIAVASGINSNGQLPVSQNDFDWRFQGLLALYDPPKKDIKATLQQFQMAGIKIKMLTGDNAETAMNIAGQVGIANNRRYVTGEQVVDMNDRWLQETIKETNVFARMFPMAKLKVIEALSKSGEIVAMTGDGVNDGPALKRADIGIAMGKKGTEIARLASDLVLTDDRLGKLSTAVGEGRKIFNNLKKAIRYIITIHIPIILVASVPLILGWVYPNIFTPIHVIFLELIMGPTCSIFFEREPIEEDLMKRSPRNRNKALFNGQELSISIVQGLIIAAGVLSLYYYFMINHASLELTRTIVFTTILINNIFLTFATRSFTKSILTTIKRRNNLVVPLLAVSAIFLATILLVPFVRELFKLSPISMQQFWLCFGVAFVSVMWFEVYKISLRPGTHMQQ